MYRVTYKLFKRYSKERQFDSVEAARKFFYGYCVRSKDVTGAELEKI